MKAPITIAVLALHAAIITTILLPLGCSSDDPEMGEVNPELTKPNTVTEVSDALPEGSEGLRAAPTRPADKLPGTSNEVIISETITETIQPISTIQPAPTINPSVTIAHENAETYTVKSGDNLTKIASRNNVSVEELMHANSLTRNSGLKIGQILTIPAGSNATVAIKNPAEMPVPTMTSDLPTTGVTSYTVQKGDSLSKIAVKFNTSIKQIMELNGMKNTVVQLGQKLKVPASNGAAAVQVKSSTQASASSSKNVSTEGKLTHKFASGETLGVVAKKYKVSVAKLMEMNSIKDPRRIRAGQVIIVGNASSGAETNVVAESAPKQVPVNAIKIEPDSPIAPQLDSATVIMPQSTPAAPALNELPEIQEI